jgi:hypothetical protein
MSALDHVSVVVPPLLTCRGFADNATVRLAEAVRTATVVVPLALPPGPVQVKV